MPPDHQLDYERPAVKPPREQPSGLDQAVTAFLVIGFVVILLFFAWLKLGEHL